MKYELILYSKVCTIPMYYTVDVSIHSAIMSGSMKYRAKSVPAKEAVSV